MTEGITMNERIVAPLRKLSSIIDELHYGRMPSEVEAAMVEARAALAELDAAPAAKEPLTDEQIDRAILDCPGDSYALMYGDGMTVGEFRVIVRRCARAVIAAHCGEKQ
jgi:hypothetical protein